MEKNENVEVNKGLKLLAKSSIIVFIGLFLSKLLTYVYKIIIARYYGPEIYGVFTLAFMVLALVASLFSFGFSEGLVRYISFYRGKKQENKIRFLLRSSASILIISGLVGGVLLFFSARFISVNLFHNEELVIFLKIFSVLVPFSIFADFFLSLLRSHEKISEFSFVYNVSQNLVKVVFLGLFIFVGLNTNAIAFSYFLGIFIMFILAYLLCKYKLPSIFFKHKMRDKEKVKIKAEFISYSWPLLFSGVMNLLFSWIDSFSIAYFMDASSVGLYNSAFPIAALMGIAPELFRQLFLPLITREYSAGNLGVIKELSKQCAKWIFIINLPLFVIFFLFPEEIIFVLFGSEFTHAATALRILAFSGIFSGFNLILTNLVLMTGRSKIIFFNLIVFSILNLILNILFVPIYGINGAALSATLINIAIAMALFIEVRLFTGIVPLKRKMFKILLISSIPIILLSAVKIFVYVNTWILVFSSILFAVIFFALVYLTGCLDKNDWEIIDMFRRKYLGKN